jgi:biotin-[acetyl-CoA-carboxylase] ligase BirA-like protein
MGDIYERVLGEKFAVPLLFKEETGSTNVDAMEMLRAGEIPPFTVLAKSQSAAYGQRKSPWVGNIIGNLYLSHALIVTPGLKERFEVLPYHVAAKICSMLQKKFSINAEVKYPNDMLVASKKIGGLLLEIVRSGEEIVFAVLGIGVNVLVSPQIDGAAYSAACLNDFCENGLDFADTAIAIIESSTAAIIEFGTL